MLARLILLSLLAVPVGCASAPTREPDTLSDLRPLTTGFAAAVEPRLSADGRWAMIQASPGAEQASAYQVYVAPVRSSGDKLAGLGPAVRITPDGTANASGAFAPTPAASLYFSSSARGDLADAATVPSRASMQLFRADGWQAAMAVVERGVGFDFARHPITRDADARSGDATFTPDGNWLIFASDRAGDIDLWAMRPDGREARQLTTTRGPDRQPAVSPDGKRVAYTNAQQQIVLADLVADGRGGVALANPQPLTRTDLASASPTWHPSGQYVLFTARPATGGDTDLYLIRTDGHRRCRITFAPNFDGQATFTRDGSQLLWSSARDGPARLYLANFKLPGWVKTTDLRPRG